MVAFPQALRQRGPGLVCAGKVRGSGSALRGAPPDGLAARLDFCWVNSSCGHSSGHSHSSQTSGGLPHAPLVPGAPCFHLGPLPLVVERSGAGGGSLESRVLALGPAGTVCTVVCMLTVELRSSQGSRCGQPPVQGNASFCGGEAQRGVHVAGRVAGRPSDTGYICVCL